MLNVKSKLDAFPHLKLCIKKMKEDFIIYHPVPALGLQCNVQMVLHLPLVGYDVSQMLSGLPLVLLLVNKQI